jgi:hypothetical protein
MRVIACLLLAACALAAQFVNYRGVVNSASFAPPGSPSGQIAQGSVFSIFGSQIGPSTPVQASAFPLQDKLAGVSVSVTQGAATLPAFPIVVTAGQVNAIMPSKAPLGLVSVTVTYNGVTSNPTFATVVASSFGIFAVNSGGFGPGILQNFVTQANQPINTLRQTAAPGQVITRVKSVQRPQSLLLGCGSDRLQGARQCANGVLRPCADPNGGNHIEQRRYDGNPDGRRALFRSRQRHCSPIRQRRQSGGGDPISQHAPDRC